MPSSEAISNESFPVGGARHTRISFDIATPRGADLRIGHFRAGQLLANECRPLVTGSRALQIKTHPEASHIVCQLYVNGTSVGGVRFLVDCDRRIEPTGRYFIVIGAMKAGTTTLFELLAQHPALCRTWAETPGVSFTKEINYFRRLYKQGNTPLHYDWRFPFDATSHAWTLEVSPNYAKWPASRAVPRRIASLGGQVKLAYILREPVDRIESHLAHKLRAGKSTHLRQCIRTSRYAMQLDKFSENFARADILLLDFQQLRREPAAILAQVCDFLDIDRFVSSTMVHNRRGVEFRLPSKQRTELAEILRPDVQRLISHYGFTPANGWLQNSAFGRISLTKFRR